MAAIPLGPETLGLLLLVVALANLVNSVVGMAVEAMIAVLTPPERVGKVSAWFQAGNLGGNGLGGALGLFLIQVLPHPWMSGAVMGVLFMACCFALLWLPDVPAHVTNQKPLQAVRAVSTSLWTMVKTRDGFLTAFLCMLPVATGAAQGTLTQATVAEHWGAGAGDVELVQGLMAGFITALGCFGGGWVCHRMNARKAYSIFGIMMAAVAIAMAYGPATINAYIWWNMLYSFVVGLSYAGFTAMVLVALQGSAAATGYNVFASLSNFPIWWLGLLLGFVADHYGPKNMLLTEAALGVAGVVLFLGVDRLRKVKVA